MKIETLRKSHKKEIIIGVSIFVILSIVLIVKFTFAKYELVKSIKIAKGTINYKVPDFKMMAMYKNNGNDYVEIDTMPESGYAINKERSYCTVDNINKVYNKMYTDIDGSHVIIGLEKNSKCYLYFDKICIGKACMLENVKVNENTPDFNKIADTDEGLFKTKDDDGDTYYYRGAVENNYVKFAGFYWRIIRINGDGTIRMIYDGTEPHQNGEATSDSIAVANVKFSHKDGYIDSTNEFKNNAYSKDKAYAGFQYTIGEAHGLSTKSNALTELENWYKDNLNSYASKIDTNAGFCGDRNSYVDYEGTTNEDGIGNAITGWYAPFVRLTNEHERIPKPDLKCNNTKDLYTISSSNKGSKSLSYPIGLISADEAAVAGGVYITENQRYYLYNGKTYWTMSPFYYSIYYNSNFMFGINLNGGLTPHYPVTLYNLRPVINLKDDIKFTGKGTITDPFVVFNDRRF